MGQSLYRPYVSFFATRLSILCTFIHVYHSVATFDVLRAPSRAQPFVLLQPRLSLQDLLPHVDLAAAAKDDRLPNLDAAYVGMVEQSGSLYVLSPDRYPLVVFGDTNTFDEQYGYGAEYAVGRTAGRLIDPPPGLGHQYDDQTADMDMTGDHDFAVDMDSITRAMKRKRLREMCSQLGAAQKDKRCLTGVRRMEDSRLSRLLDGAPTVPLPYHPKINSDIQNLYDGPNKQPAQTGNGSSSDPSGRPQLGSGSNHDQRSSHGFGTYGLGMVTIFLAFLIARFARKRVRDKEPRATIGNEADHILAASSASSDHGSLQDINGASNGYSNAPLVTDMQPSYTKLESLKLTSVPSPPIQNAGQFSPGVTSESDLTSQPPTHGAIGRSSSRKVSFGEVFRVAVQDGDDVNEGTGVEGDDSDNDAQAAPGKKKPVRRRRGKKKPKIIIANGAAGDDDGGAVGEKDAEKDVDSPEWSAEPKQSGVVHVVSPSTNVVPTPATSTPVVPSLIVSDTILGER